MQYLKPRMFSFVFLSILMAAGYLGIFSSIGVLLKLILNLVQNNVFTSQDMKRVIFYLVIIVCCSPLLGLALYGVRRIERITADDMRDDMMHSVLNANEQSIEKYPVQEIHNRMMTDVGAAAEWLCGYNMAGWVL